MLGLDDLRRDFDLVVVAATDIQGRQFGRRVPVGRFLELDHVSACSCVLAWDIAQEPSVELAFAGPHTGWHDVALVPDHTTLRRAAWLPRTAYCIADITDVDTGSRVDVDPRSMLARQVAALADRGYRALVATEPEFYLYRGSYDAAREDDYRGLAPSTASRGDYTIHHGDVLHEFFARALQTLEAAEVPVEALQTEWGLGQCEVSLRHTDPLAAADRHVLTKLALRRVADEAGLAATFMAQPESDAVGSSCHVHLSLETVEGAPAFWDAAAADHLTPVARASIGGALRHLGDLMLFYAPTVNSYRRTRREQFAGWGLTWGYDNRTVTCRVVGASPGSLRIEFRTPGADANPYLVLAALLASVVSGLDSDADPGEPVVGDAYAQRGDAGELPTDLLAAGERLRGSSWAARAFGKPVLEHCAGLARMEWNEFALAVTDWERRRYFELT